MLLPVLVYAETVYLKSGKTVEGRIIEKDAQAIQIEVYGMPLTYFLDDIERIEEGRAKEATAEASDKALFSGTYTNTIYGFSIANPSGWKKFENVQTLSKTDILVYYTLLDEPRYPYIGVSVTCDSILPFPDVKNVMDFTLKMLARLKESGAKVLEEPTNVQIGGVQATRMKLIHPVKIYEEGVDKDVYIIWYQVLKDNGVITLALTGLASQFNQQNTVLEKMLETFKFIPRDSPVFTEKEEALCKAIVQNDLEKVKGLLGEGAQVNVREPSQGATPFILSVIAGNEEIAQLLLTRGANINQGDALNTTPLIFAVSLQKEKMVEFLVREGADLNIKDSAGYTALMVAQEKPQENAGIIEILRQAAAK
jgi:hypothetical protein